MKTVLTLACALVLVTLAGCSSKKSPVLYPNHHLNTVGQQTAQADIADCMRKAEASGANAGQAQQVARQTTNAAVVGGAAGAAAGAASSNRSVGRGAATGAAGAGTAALVRGSIEAKNPSPIFKRYVDQCLRDKGYQPLGWR